MRRLYLAASGLGLSVAVSLAMANPPVFEGADPANSDLVAFDPLTPPPVNDAAAAASQAADPAAVLREEYLKLMQEKAALMDKAALEAALNSAQQDIKELKGEELLNEAKAILKRVAEEYPNTRAASEASALIGQYNGYRAPVPADGSFKPL